MEPLRQAAGHGGGDYFVLREFYQALLADREPPIEVYDAGYVDGGSAVVGTVDPRRQPGIGVAGLHAR